MLGGIPIVALLHMFRILIVALDISRLFPSAFCLGAAWPDRILRGCEVCLGGGFAERAFFGGGGGAESCSSGKTAAVEEINWGIENRTRQHVNPIGDELTNSAHVLNTRSPLHLVNQARNEVLVTLQVIGLQTEVSFEAFPHLLQGHGPAKGAGRWFKRHASLSDRRQNVPPRHTRDWPRYLSRRP